MRHNLKYFDKMRFLRKRSAVSFLGVLVICLLFMNLYIEDGYVLVSFLDGRKPGTNGTKHIPGGSVNFIIPAVSHS